MTHIFIYFESNINDACYSTIPKDILKNNFTFVACNPLIPKSYDITKYHVIKEWELPVYNSDLQKQGYKENSVLYHVYANDLHEKYDKIGFFNSFISFKDVDIRKYILNSDLKICYTCWEVRYDDAFEKSITPKEYNAFLIQNYEKYFRKRINKQRSIPLLNLFIVDTTVYVNIMKWIEKLYSNYYKILKNPYTYISGIYERVTGLALSQQDITFIKMEKISHCINM